MYNLFDYASMLAYKARVDKFTEALTLCRPEGAVVCEIGTGFGYFAILAAKLGARRVYAIESNEAVQLGSELAADNGVADRIEWIHGLSTETMLPERADILISDLRSTTPLNGEHIRAIADARARFLKTDGKLIPGRDTLRCAISTHGGIHSHLLVPWQGAISESVDLRRVSELLAKASRRSTFRPEHLMPEFQTLGELDYRSIESPDLEVTRTWQIGQGGVGNGLCIWFESELAPGVFLSGAPGQAALPYGHLYLPWRHPILLEPGTWITIHLEASLQQGEYHWTWTVDPSEGPSAMKSHAGQTAFARM